MIRSRRVWPIALVMLATGFVHGQQDVPAGYVFHADQEVRVRDLSPQVARSTSTTAVLIAVLETIFRDAAVCCGKNSALQDGVEAADPLSLKDVGAKIQGRRPGQDGRPVTITAEYMARTPLVLVRLFLPSRAIVRSSCCGNRGCTCFMELGSTKSFITPASGTTSFISSSYWIFGFRTRAERFPSTARATIGARCKGCWRYLSWPRSKALLPGFVRGGTHDSQSSNRTPSLTAGVRSPVSRFSRFLREVGFLTFQVTG